MGWMCDSRGARGALLVGGAATTLAVVAGMIALVNVRGRALSWSFVAGRTAPQPA